MVAFLDKTRKSYFVLDEPGTGILFGRDLSISLNAEALQSHTKGYDHEQGPQNPWAVCRHLSGPESLMAYYLKAGFIMVLLGKCLCQECHELILASRDLTSFLESCEHMSDLGLQKNFFNPLIWINGKTMKASHDRWACCPHVSKKAGLERLYRGSPIFFHAGQVTCTECMGIPFRAGSLFSEHTMMNDDLFQATIVDRLYPLNTEILKTIRSRA